MYYRPFEREVLFTDEVLIFLDDRTPGILPLTHLGGLKAHNPIF